MVRWYVLFSIATVGGLAELLTIVALNVFLPLQQNTRPKLVCSYISRAGQLQWHHWPPLAIDRTDGPRLAVCVCRCDGSISDSAYMVMDAACSLVGTVAVDPVCGRPCAFFFRFIFTFIPPARPFGQIAHAYMHTEM